MVELINSGTRVNNLIDNPCNSGYTPNYSTKKCTSITPLHYSAPKWTSSGLHDGEGRWDTWYYCNSPYFVDLMYVHYGVMINNTANSTSKCMHITSF